MKVLEKIIEKLCAPLSPLPTGQSDRLDRIDGIKAVLFDVYGTLLISGSGDVGTAAATDTAEALARSLEAAGFPGDLEQAGKAGKETLKEEVLKWHERSRNAGIDYPEVDILEIWRTVINRLRKDRIIEDPEDRRDPIPGLALEYECRVNPAWPMPGCLETLQALKAGGYVLGIVSNAQFYTPVLFSGLFNKSVEELGFDPDCCIWSYQELKGKPSDDLFPKVTASLARNYGITPAETVYVGNDMLNDVYTASHAGCKTVLFAGDRRSLRLREDDERCRRLQPDAVITSLPRLPGLLRNAAPSSKRPD